MTIQPDESWHVRVSPWLDMPADAASLLVLVVEGGTTGCRVEGRLILSAWERAHAGHVDALIEAKAANAWRSMFALLAEVR